jgi:hypothetical protein
MKNNNQETSTNKEALFHRIPSRKSFSHPTKSKFFDFYMQTYKEFLPIKLTFQLGTALIMVGLAGLTGIASIPAAALIIVGSVLCASLTLGTEVFSRSHASKEFDELRTNQLQELREIAQNLKPFHAQSLLSPFDPAIYAEDFITNDIVSFVTEKTTDPNFLNAILEAFELCKPLSDQELNNKEKVETLLKSLSSSQDIEHKQHPAPSLQPHPLHKATTPSQSKQVL